MKVVDAFWEKRNMGISVTEVIVEDSDSIEDLTGQLSLLNSNYFVVKTSVNRGDMLFELSKLGFTFVEAMTHLTHNMILPPLSVEKQKKLDSVLFIPMNQQDIEVLYEEMRNGLYKTDRVSLDSNFTKEQSANRYIGWLGDELGRGSEAYKFVYEGQIIGFIAFKKISESIYQDLMSAIYPPFAGKGFAVNMTYKLVDELRQRGCMNILVEISTNNVASLQSRIRHGYVIDKFTYVFVKHN